MPKNLSHKRKEKILYDVINFEYNIQQRDEDEGILYNIVMIMIPSQIYYITEYIHKF